MKIFANLYSEEKYTLISDFSKRIKQSKNRIKYTKMWIAILEILKKINNLYSSKLSLRNEHSSKETSGSTSFNQTSKES